MSGLLRLVNDILRKSESLEFQKFLDTIPTQNNKWYMLSDYCLDDKNKFNDVFTFTLLCDQNNINDLKKEIKKIAPKDLKKSKKVSPKFAAFLNSNMMYHFSFVITKESKLLKELIPKESVVNMLTNMYNFIEEFKSKKPEKKEYFLKTQKKIKLIINESSRQNFNMGLFRKIFFTAIFGASVIYILKRLSNPIEVKWISDRDAMLDKYECFIFDYLYFNFQFCPSSEYNSNNTFDIGFGLPNIYYDELIRIPDYIAGTLASNDLGNTETFRDMQIKHQDVIIKAMNKSINQANLRILWKDLSISIENFKYDF